MDIDTYDKLLAMYQLQKANLATYQTEVGATDADILEVGEAADNLQYMADYFGLADAGKRTVAQVKRAIFDGDPNEPVTDFGGFPAFNPPHALIAGLQDRARRRNRRFKAADDYTKEIGIALGIETESSKTVIGSVKPSIEVFAAQSDYHFSIVVNGRGAANMGRDDSAKKCGEWTNAKTASGKSVDVTVTPTAPGTPEQLQVRVQLKKNNENYGEPSDIVYVTVNP